jgi:carboxyl-terminal processing protease
MRAPLAVSVTLFASAILAAPVPPPGPTDAPLGPRPQQVQAEARQFALALLRTTDQISTYYVRPVSREELLLTALTGLFQAARLPVPQNLRAEIHAVLAEKTRTASVESMSPEANLADASAEDQAAVDLIQHVREHIGDAATLRDRSPLLICCQEIARSLDPYSGVVTGRELRRNLAVEEDAESYGLELNDNAGFGPAVVTLIKPGGPAQQAGVRPGDEITQLDDEPVKELGRLELLRRLLLPPDAPELHKELPPPPPPPPGAVPPGAAVLPAPGPNVASQAAQPPPPSLKMTMRRCDGKAATVTLRARRFRPEATAGLSRQDDNSWTYWVDSKSRLAHIRLAALNKGSAEELRQVVSALQAGGLRGLILDMRWCPGGFLDEAVDAARVFLSEGVVATIRSRGREDLVYRSDGQNAFTDFPILVLVNGETSGGAELIAAALQDRGRAVVAGQRTLGKGSVQTQIALAVPGAALKLTNGVFLRPNGKEIQRKPGASLSGDWGVRPEKELEFRVSPDLAKRMKEEWQRQTLRPGVSMERLPLDDPDADPQRQAAAEALRDLVQSKMR